jgi:hypothetical protein
MNEPFIPEQFGVLPGDAKIVNELRRWLRSIPALERIDFIKKVWLVNYRLSISLIRSSQLSIKEAIDLLQYWVVYANHNAARGLIEGFIPVLGEERFWKAVIEVELSPTMEDFLNYHGHDKLKQLKNGKQNAQTRSDLRPFIFP